MLSVDAKYFDNSNFLTWVVFPGLLNGLLLKVVVFVLLFSFSKHFLKDFLHLLPMDANRFVLNFTGPKNKLHFMLQ